MLTSKEKPMRLTKKNNGKYVYDDIYCGEHIDKLGQLEDIEEICLKLKTEPLYEKTTFGEIYKEDYTEYNIYYDFNSRSIVIYDYEYVNDYPMEEYGKTWALTEEELL